MDLSLQLAKHFREVHFGGNWTSVNLKDTLEGVNWQQATTPVESLNTIAKLLFHINYYVEAVMKVLKGGTLDAKDKFSFDVSFINSKEEWDALVEKALKEAEEFSSLVEKIPGGKLSEVFVDEKYGTYLRNLLGIIEHTHYHLGQIRIIKKLLDKDGK